MYVILVASAFKGVRSVCVLSLSSAYEIETIPSAVSIRLSALCCAQQRQSQ